MVLQDVNLFTGTIKDNIKYGNKNATDEEVIKAAKLANAHRLSIVRNSKTIIVLEHGHIIERGTHDELMNLKGEYYQLYTGVFELE